MFVGSEVEFDPDLGDGNGERPQLTDRGDGGDEAGRDPAVAVGAGAGADRGTEQQFGDRDVGAGLAEHEIEWDAYLEPCRSFDGEPVGRRPGDTEADRHRQAEVAEQRRHEPVAFTCLHDQLGGVAVVLGECCARGDLDGAVDLDPELDVEATHDQAGAGGASDDRLRLGETGLEADLETA